MVAEENGVYSKSKTRVKNKAPAPVQITAEQLIREAKERELEVIPPPPKQKILDQSDLNEFQLRKRKEFEDNLRKSATNVSYWTKYATWEEIQGEIDRARSIYERALDMDSRNITFWIKYIELEIKHKQINHARNLFDRAVTLLPRADQIWYKYVHMEEMLQQFSLCRQVFERWMKWSPDEQAWNSYINFEQRCGETDKAREIFSKYVTVHSKTKNWVRYAKFELKNGNVNECRKVYETAIDYLGKNGVDAELVLAFAKFEQLVKEYERAIVILSYGKDKLEGEESKKVQSAYLSFQKQFGDKLSINDAIIVQRKQKYEEELKKEPLDYDTWFDYLILCEKNCIPEEVEDSYEKAISNIPTKIDKNSWGHYIYLWVYYSVFVEYNLKKREKSIEIYEKCLELLENYKISFSKIWLNYAKTLVRNDELPKARQKLGLAIGKFPSHKLFREYIEMELELLEFDRCRKLYENWLKFSPNSAIVWIKYFELESLLNEHERARSILKIAIDLPSLNNPEILWKTLIDYEISFENYDTVRGLYKDLLNKTIHPKVWMAYAKFELSLGDIALARNVYQDANKTYLDVVKEIQNNSSSPNSGSFQNDSLQFTKERAKILNSWLEFEKQNGDENEIKRVEKLQPQKVKKRRQIFSSDGSEAGWEEYFDYIFPEDQASKPNIKLLSMAKRWKNSEKSDQVV